jgi:hypothetical protein
VTPSYSACGCFFGALGSVAGASYSAHWPWRSSVPSRIGRGQLAEGEVPVLPVAGGGPVAAAGIPVVGTPVVAAEGEVPVPPAAGGIAGVLLTGLAIDRRCKTRCTPLVLMLMQIEFL